MWGGHGNINLGGTLGRGSESTGVARMALARSEEDFGKAFDARVVRRMWGFVAPYKMRVLLSLSLLVVYSASVILYPLIPGLAINAIIQHQPRRFVFICALFVVNNTAMWLAQYQQVYQMT